MWKVEIVCLKELWRNVVFDSIKSFILTEIIYIFCSIVLLLFCKDSRYSIWQIGSPETRLVRFRSFIMDGRIRTTWQHGYKCQVVGEIIFRDGGLHKRSVRCKPLVIHEGKGTKVWFFNEWMKMKKLFFVARIRFRESVSSNFLPVLVFSLCFVFPDSRDFILRRLRSC